MGGKVLPQGPDWLQSEGSLFGLTGKSADPWFRQLNVGVSPKFDKQMQLGAASELYGKAAPASVEQDS